MKKILLLFSLLNLLFINTNVIQKSPIACGNRNKNYIYLTFDDGYSAKNTAQILDVLKEKNVCATFFVEGGFLTQNPGLVRRIADEQTLANHTFSHKDITKMSDEEFIQDIKRFEEEAYAITKREITKYFRPPMGKIDDDKLKILNELGYDVFLWNVSYYDYVYNDDQGVDYALSNLLSQTKNGSIILMHTLTKSNALVLSTAIDKLREKGFEFRSLSELVKWY